jgi:hypothetical protein
MPRPNLDFRLTQRATLLARLRIAIGLFDIKRAMAAFPTREFIASRE